MVESEQAPKLDQRVESEHATEQSTSIEGQLPERLRQLDGEIAGVRQGLPAPDAEADLRGQKEQESASQVSNIEGLLGATLKEESRQAIRGRLVEEPVDQVQNQRERLRRLEVERQDLALSSALDRIRGYGDTELKRRHAQVWGWGGEARHEEPYELRLPRENPQLEFLGVAHSNDPESPMTKKVKERLSEYVNRTPTENAVLMIEGMHGGISKEKLDDVLQGVKSEEEAVRKFGEKGVLMWTAREKNIDISSPEIPSAEVVSDLIGRGHERDDLAMYLLLRRFTNDIGQEGAEGPDEPHMHFAREFLHINELTGVNWIGAETKHELDQAIAAGDIETIRSRLAMKVLEEFSGKANERFRTYPGVGERKLIPSLNGLLKRNKGVPDAEMVSMDDVNELHDPVDGRGGPTNRISTEWNLERDKFIVKQIDDAMRKGKKPFVVYGGSHALAVEPALEELMKRTHERRE